jgi:hypothetical protein
MTIRFGSGGVELPDNRACLLADLLAEYPGRVIGRVLDSSGNPLPHLTVEMVSAEAWDFAPYRLRGVTDGSGYYAISGVEPGSYVPGVVVGSTIGANGPEPLYLFGGSTTTKSVARRLEIRGGSRRTAGDLIVPETTRIAQITGTVVHADGRPAASVKVRTKVADGESFPWTTIRTDSRGVFSFALVIGMRYRLVAEPENNSGKVAERTLDPSQSIPTLRLVLQ